MGQRIITIYSIVFTQDYVFPIFRCHTWKENIQANERLTKIKEKLSNIKSDVFVLSFSLFKWDNKCHKQKWRVLFFTRIKLVASVLACAHVIAHTKWRRLHYVARTERYCSAYGFYNWWEISDVFTLQCTVY